MKEKKIIIDGFDGVRQYKFTLRLDVEENVKKIFIDNGGNKKAVVGAVFANNVLTLCDTNPACIAHEAFHILIEVTRQTLDEDTTLDELLMASSQDSKARVLAEESFACMFSTIYEEIDFAIANDLTL